jgi:hypothetical protein
MATARYGYRSIGKMSMESHRLLAAARVRALAAEARYS